MLYFRALVALHIGTDSIQAVCRDGRVILLSHEMEELKDFLLTQVSHQMPNGPYFHTITGSWMT